MKKQENPSVTNEVVQEAVQATNEIKVATLRAPKPSITDEMREKLRAQFPVKAYSKHKNKTYLGSLKPQYIVERLNSVFGIGRWALKHKVVFFNENEVLVEGILKFKDYDVLLTKQYGGHKTQGKGTELVDGYKSAVTDCLGKCASYLEIANDLFKGAITFRDGYLELDVNQEPIVPGQNESPHLKDQGGGGDDWKNNDWKNKSNDWKSKNTQKTEGSTGTEGATEVKNPPEWLKAKVNKMIADGLPAADIIAYGKNLNKNEKYKAMTEQKDFKEFMNDAVKKAGVK